MQSLLEAQNLGLAGGEIWLTVGALVLLLVGAFLGERATAPITGLAIALLIIAGIWVHSFTPMGSGMHDSFVMDPFARLMKLLVIIAAVFSLIMSVGFNRREGFERYEFSILLLMATVGMMLMISANNMITLYLGLELQSLSLYVIAAINRESIRSAEAGLKYFVLGALASGLLLYGISLVYGFTGHVDFPGIREVVAGTGIDVGHNIGLTFGLVFILCGICFKISAVPFHMWTPDVYEGAPTSVTAYFASAPKIAAMALLVRVVVGPFGGITSEWQQVLSFIAIASMALGAFGAIGQTNIKRMMAYSAIGNTGFALVGLASGTEAGVNGVIMYMLIYMVMTLGVFAGILSMRTRDGMVENIHDLAGLSTRRPLMAFLLAMIMFALAGIPPLGGFFGKYFVFMAAIEAHLVALAVIGVITSVISAFYYLRIIKIMWFDEGDRQFVPMTNELRLVLGLCGVFLLLFVLVAGPVETMTASAAHTFFTSQ